MRADPGDPEARLLLAKVYLDLEQGDLAHTAIEQAVERGLAPQRASLPLGRALFLERRWSDLLVLDVPPDLGVTERTTLLYLQAEARAARSGSVDGSDDTVVRAHIELFAATKANAENPEIAAIAALLADSRAERADIDRAWQHYACSRQDAAAVGWRPIARPGGRVLQVGPDRELNTIAAAAKLARDGDIVEIDPGTYRGDVALWPQNNLVVRGVGERPSLIADGKSIQRRDVWLFTGDDVVVENIEISGDDVVVENIEISGARSPWENGAGIRHVGSGLTLRHVFLHDNENGLLVGNRYPDTNEILIEYSEFADNGDDGRSKRFELRYSYSRGSQGGHLVKSRAQENLITYNRLTEEEGGRSSYIIDIPEGGMASIVGNVIEQGAATLNHGMISYAGESNKHLDNRLSIVNNSIYNRDFKGVVVRNHADLDVVLVNNLLGGTPAVTTDSVVELVNNLMRPDHGMQDPRSYAFGLVAGAQAIDAGVEFEITPSKEYVHPARWRPRESIWKIDVGAYERCGID
jgi:hypothetical protein